MRTVISLVFGPLHAPTGWAGEEDLPVLPMVGQTLVIDFDNVPVPSVRGQIFRTWEDPDLDTASVLIYAGHQPPADGTADALTGSGWQQLSNDTVTHLARVVEETPVIAAVHEVVLAVGGSTPATTSVYRRTLNPDDPVLPLLGQRLLVDVLENNELDEDDPEFDDDEYLAKINDHLRGVGSPRVSEFGLPVLTVHTSELQKGSARILMWTPHLGDVPEGALLDTGWVKTSPEDRCLDPDFRLARRVNLAMRTELTLQENDYSSVSLGDWYINDPSDVTEEDKELLPVLLWEQTVAAQEIGSLDEIVAGWSEPPAPPESTR